MTLYLLRWMALLVSLLLMPVLLIRARPYDDSQLRALLTPPDGCPAPCFMGIRPGISSADEAFAILRDHAWVDSDGEDYAESLRTYLARSAPFSRRAVDWRWRAVSSPVLVSAPGRLNMAGEQVESVLLRTSLRWGDVLLALGDPGDRWFIASNSRFGPRYTYVVWYADYHLRVEMDDHCPLRDLYRQPVLLVVRPDASVVGLGESRQTVCR